MRGSLLLLAAGSGDRLGASTPKALVEIAGVPMVRRAADAADGAALVDEIVVAAPSDRVEAIGAALDGVSTHVRVVAGGPNRQSSAAIALAAVGDAEAIVVHDAARALCPSLLFDLCLRELDSFDAVCVGVPLSDTIREVEREVVVRTLDRSVLVAAQTPQAFRADVYRRAHERARRDAFVATDDAALVERIGVSVRIVPGLPMQNLKITTPVDLALAEALITWAEHR